MKVSTPQLYLVGFLLCDFKHTCKHLYVELERRSVCTGVLRYSFYEYSQYRHKSAVILTDRDTEQQTATLAHDNFSYVKNRKSCILH